MNNTYNLTAMRTSCITSANVQRQVRFGNLVEYSRTVSNLARASDTHPAFGLSFIRVFQFLITKTTRIRDQVWWSVIKMLISYQ